MRLYEKGQEIYCNEKSSSNDETREKRKKTKQRDLYMTSSDRKVPSATERLSERIGVSSEPNTKQIEKDKRADWGIFEQ